MGTRTALGCCVLKHQKPLQIPSFLIAYLPLFVLYAHNESQREQKGDPSHQQGKHIRKSNAPTTESPEPLPCFPTENLLLIIQISPFFSEKEAFLVGGDL